MNVVPLVDSSWLREHLTAPELRIVDCDAPQAYRRAHIPGAVALPAHPWLKSGHEMRASPAGSTLSEVPAHPHVMSKSEFEQVASRLGISSDTVVIAYDALNMSFATRLWWVLRHYGHRHVSVLDGGWRGWLSGGGEVGILPSRVEETRFEAAEALPPTICRIDELLARFDQPDVQVLNVLPEAWFRGEANPFGNRRIGHIPGSVNIPASSFLGADGAFRRPRELQELVESAGLSPDRETIVHCQAGILTTLGVFALHLLGWKNVRAYDGAMAEWANRDDTPLTTATA